MDQFYRDQVQERIKRKLHLEPVFTSSHDIPERLYEYDNSFFMVFNHKTKKFEIHNLDQIGDSYCMVVPFRQLDVRTVRWVWQNDIRMHGKEIFRKLERQEKALEEAKDRERRNWIRDMASETQSLFAKDAWTFAT